MTRTKSERQRRKETKLGESKRDPSAIWREESLKGLCRKLKKIATAYHIMKEYKSYISRLINTENNLH